MIERACDGKHAFDVIAVQSCSRFLFCDAIEQEFYLRKLAKHSTKPISITRPLGDDDDPAQATMRKAITMFDEYQSMGSAKHVLRNMKLNAQLGFCEQLVRAGIQPHYGASDGHDGCSED